MPLLKAVRNNSSSGRLTSILERKLLLQMFRYVIERKRIQRRLAAHHAVTRVLAEAETLDEATPQILKAVCESSAWEIGVLWHIHGDYLQCVALWHKPGAAYPEFTAASRDRVFARGVGFPGRIWEQAKAIWVVNVAADPACPRAEIAAQEGLHAALGFPVTIDHQVLGVIELFGRRTRKPDQDLIRMMATMGSQIGQFIVRKQAEAALAREHNILRTLVDTLPDAIYVKDSQSRFVLGNLSVAHLMGTASGEQLLGKTDFDFYPPDLAARYYADEQAILHSGQPLVNREEPVLAPDKNQRWFLTTKVPLRNGAQEITGLVGIGRDITDLRSSHAQLKAAQLQLIQAAKMESVGTLAAGVAHEVKNPLQTILMGLAYLSKTTTTANENITSVLANMHDAVTRADAIVRDLLYLSAPKQLEIKAHDLNRTVEHALWLVNYELTRARILVVRDLAPDLPPTPLDEAKMEQVFINLFINAAQAMSAGGTLTVRTFAKPFQDDAPWCDLPSGPFVTGDTLVVTEIQDTGVGIPQEKFDRVFEPFFTTKPKGIGTGLGLPVTKQIVDLHGGVINLEPASSGGVRACLILKAEKEMNYETKTHTPCG